VSGYSAAKVQRMARNGRAGNGSLLAATVDALGGTLGLRCGQTGAHCGRVVALACRLGRRLGLAPAALRDLDYAARLHDIGKVGVPDALLQKAGALNEDEWRLVRGHSAWGARLVEGIPGLERVSLIVRHHHERFDGDGYPDGLRGDDIPMESRILAAADAYVAMTEDRPYRRALSNAAVERELRAGRAQQFDPDVVEALEAELREERVSQRLAG
jgi:HD-GYP domain-containing protein (c-di-GMP phosphodiesterase class II)